MAVTLRTTTVAGATNKGSALTHAELDENFIFTQSGTGAIATTVENKLRNFRRKNVFDFIPTALWSSVEDGTNTTDLTTYLQAAIDSGAKVLDWPYATYLMTRLNPVSGQRWAGASKIGTLLTWAQSNKLTPINMIQQASAISDFEVEDMGFRGGLLVQTTADDDGQDFACFHFRHASSVDGVALRRLRIREFGDQSKVGGAAGLFGATSGSSLTMRDIEIVDVTVEDIANVPGFFISAPSAQYSTAKRIKVVRPRFYINQNYADQNCLYITGDSGGRIYSVDVEDPRFEIAQSIDAAIELNYVDGFHIDRMNLRVTGAANATPILIRSGTRNGIITKPVLLNDGTGCLTHTGIGLLQFNAGELQENIQVISPRVKDFKANAMQISSGCRDITVSDADFSGDTVRLDVGCTIAGAKRVSFTGKIKKAAAAFVLSTGDGGIDVLNLDNIKLDDVGRDDVGDPLIKAAASAITATNVKIGANIQVTNPVSGTTYLIDPDFADATGNTIEQQNSLGGVKLLHPSRAGLVKILGASGNFQKRRYEDDFLGDVLRDEWTTAVGTDAQCIAATISAGVPGGRVVLTAGDDAAVSMAANGSQLVLGRNWETVDGVLTAEFRLALDTVTNVCCFIGFTDNIALEMPFTLGAGNALTSNATDAVGVLFDTAADTDQWCLVGVAADVDATKQFSGSAPTAGVSERWKIEITEGTVATFYRNGVQVGTAMTGAVRNNQSLTPYVGIFSRTTAAMEVRLDRVVVEQNEAFT